MGIDWGRGNRGGMLERATEGLRHDGRGRNTGRLRWKAGTGERGGIGFAHDGRHGFLEKGHG